jgi:hypothetical protein
MKTGWIVSEYSKKNHSEWFCELLMFYVENKLNSEQEQWIIDLLKIK